MSALEMISTDGKQCFKFLMILIYRSYSNFYFLVRMVRLQIDLPQRYVGAEPSSLILTQSLFFKDSVPSMSLSQIERFRCDEVDHLSAHVLIGTRMSRIEDFCGSETPPRLMSTKNLLTLDYVIRSTKAMRRMVANAEKFGFVVQYDFRSDLGLSKMNAETRSDQGNCLFEISFG